jgi:hypothetical protein
MRVSVVAATGVAGRRNAHPQPPHGRLQEVATQTLIEGVGWYPLRETCKTMRSDGT